jgi:cell division protein FtsQ
MLQLLAWAVALTLVALPVVGMLNGWFAVERWPVRYLKVEAEYNHVSAEQIRAAVESRLGAGFFAVRLDEVRAAVAALPWVESAEVRKQWPDTLLVYVRERQPFARWGEDRLIDRNGNLFRVPGGEALQGLPELAGPDDALARVVDFYTATLPRFSGSGLVLTGVSLSERGSWTLTLEGGARILLGRDDVERRLARFLAVYPQLAASHGGAFQHADLRYSNGFAVSWSAPAPSAPVPDQPAAGTTAAETHT